MAGVVHAEVDTLAVTCEVSDLRVVCVCDDPGVRIEVADQPAPALGDELELPVAVELVAKEVPETEGAGPETPGDVGKRRLINLEQAQIGAVRREQGGRDAGQEVRSRAVVGQSQLRRQDLRDHRGSRRLPVRRRHDRRPLRQLRRESPDRARIENVQQLAGEGRATAGAGEA